jgi:phytoene dehydrogenase-like protein
MKYDAVVIGSGPNGLAAAIVLAQAGYSVIVYEAAQEAGGGMRSAALTLPGFTHDVCSTVHALGMASPFFSTLPLAQHGLEWVTPTVPLAHPLDNGRAVVLERSIEKTGNNLGVDSLAYRRLMGPFINNSDALFKDILGPLHVPHHPWEMARFGLHGLRSSNHLAGRFFQGIQGRALISGLCAHANMPLGQPVTAAFGLILGLAAHTTGWPFARGGSANLARALVSYFQSLGGKMMTGTPVSSLKEFGKARAILCDITPRQLISLASDQLPENYKKKLSQYRYGSGIFKMDWALRGPIPWKAPECAWAGTIHLGGQLEEIVQSERDVGQGRHSSKPFVLLTAPSLFDSTRAPQGCHTVWAYCHVPHGSTVDMTEKIESQIERFAPGFRDLVLARHVMTTHQLENYNANYIGGDINGGIQDLRQLFFRPIISLDPYRTPIKGLYICSSSTPPGGGVHGMCGFHAAQSVLRHEVAVPRGAL